MSITTVPSDAGVGVLDDDALDRELREFDQFGSVSRTETREGVRYYINEFWTSRQRQAHRIHEVSYRACFKPQLPAFFIDRLSQPDDLVYDPFMGRGTTPIEAAIRHRRPAGNDINPLSKVLVEPRLNPPSLDAIERRLSEIPWADFVAFHHSELLVFYHPETLAHIEGLRRWFLSREADNQLDMTDKWIRMIAINRLTGHSTGFFSVYTMPPNQAVSVERQRIINERRGQVPPSRDVSAIIYKKSMSLLSQGAPRAQHNLLLATEAHNTCEVESGSVTLTVTSPPFLDVVNYEADNWLRCWFVGIDPKSVKITQLRNLEQWQCFVANTLRELARVTKPEGHIAFEVGEVRNGTINLELNVMAAAQGLPLDVRGVLINQQEFTKTANCWGVSNNRAGTNTNRIVLFRRT